MRKEEKIVEFKSSAVAKKISGLPSIGKSEAESFAGTLSEDAGNAVGELAWLGRELSALAAKTLEAAEKGLDGEIRKIADFVREFLEPATARA